MIESRDGKEVVLVGGPKHGLHVLLRATYLNTPKFDGIAWSRVTYEPSGIKIGGVELYKVKR